MLTKADLKNIREVVREEVESEIGTFKSDFQGELKITRIGIEEKLAQLNSKIKNLEVKLFAQIKKVQKDQKTITNYMDMVLRHQA